MNPSSPANNNAPLPPPPAAAAGAAVAGSSVTSAAVAGGSVTSAAVAGGSVTSGDGAGSSGLARPDASAGAAPADTHATAPRGWAITAAATLHIPEADATEHFTQLKAGLPPRAARRMSRLGLMLSHLLGQTGIDAETVVLYASAFAEGRTLETYLESFPQPSPLGFQSSIHPGGIEQALILRQQPVREFIPLTASENLPLALFRTLEHCYDAPRVLLLGGEERGTWLREQHLAADANFAFALLLEPAGSTPALGSLSSTETVATPPAAHAQTGQSLLDLCLAIEARRAIRFAHPDEGDWAISWQAFNAPS